LTTDQFNKTVQLLGGLRSVNRKIEVGYRTLQYYAAGKNEVTPGVGDLLKNALIVHSQDCLAAAQQIMEPAR
jgi:hypothetical protein